MTSLTAQVTVCTLFPEDTVMEIVMSRAKPARIGGPSITTPFARMVVLVTTIGVSGLWILGVAMTNMNTRTPGVWSVRPSVGVTMTVMTVRTPGVWSVRPSFGFTMTVMTV